MHDPSLGRRVPFGRIHPVFAVAAICNGVLLSDAIQEQTTVVESVAPFTSDGNAIVLAAIKHISIRDRLSNFFEPTCC